MLDGIEDIHSEEGVVKLFENLLGMEHELKSMTPPVGKIYWKNGQTL